MITLDQKLLRVSEINNRVQREYLHALRSWAHWEAMNQLARLDEGQLVHPIDSLNLKIPHQHLRHVLLSDALLTLFRITDSAYKDRQSLPSLAALLRDAQVAEELQRENNAALRDQPPDIIEMLERFHRTSRLHILRIVPDKWDRERPPEFPLLLLMRTKLRPVRDMALAHSLKFSGELGVELLLLRRFIRCVGLLVYLCNVVTMGRAAECRETWKVSQKQSRRYWNAAHSGFFAEVARISENEV